MAYSMTANGLKDFLGYLSEKGLLNANSAGGMKTACDKVLSVLSEEERNDLGSLDIDLAIQRFMNKNPNALTPDSASVYRSRISRAISLLADFNANSTGFRIQSARRSPNCA
jgi:hypothetical protein